MADNTILDPGTGGDTIRDKDRTGVKTQIVALDLNPAGAETLMTGVMPINDNSGSLTVDNGGTFAVQIAANSSVNMAQVVGTAIDVNSGVKSAGTQRVVLATDQPALTNALKVDGSATTQPVSGTVSAAVTNAGTFVVQENGAALTALQVIDNPVVVDDAAFGIATTSVNMAGYLADQTSTDSVNEGDAGAARMTLDRKQIVTIAPSADTEGLDIGPGTGAKQISAATTNATSVKASAGKVFGWYLYNDGASEAYLKIYNKATSPTVGTDVPVLVIPIPAGAAANVEFTQGLALGTGIATALTTGFADADTGAVAAGQVIVNLFYK